MEGAGVLEHKFTAYSQKLCRVEQFRYLGRILSFDNNDMLVMRRSLKQTATNGPTFLKSWPRTCAGDGCRRALSGHDDGGTVI